MSCNQEVDRCRKQAERCLRRMAALEQMLEFDMASLETYADSIAEERQGLTQIAAGRSNISTIEPPQAG